MKYYNVYVTLETLALDATNPNRKAIQDGYYHCQPDRKMIQKLVNTAKQTSITNNGHLRLGSASATVGFYIPHPRKSAIYEQERLWVEDFAPGIYGNIVAQDEIDFTKSPTVVIAKDSDAVKDFTDRGGYACIIYNSYAYDVLKLRDGEDRMFAVNGDNLAETLKECLTHTIPDYIAAEQAKSLEKDEECER